MSNIHGLNSSKKPAANPHNEEFSVGGQSSATAVMRPTNGPGRSSDPADLVQMAREQMASAEAEDRNIGLITLYANGFIVGNGDFRDAKVDANARFLSDLRRGDVPEEMMEMCRKEWGESVDTVRVNLVNRASETYIPPKAKFDFSQSRGQSLAQPASADAANPFKQAKPNKIQIKQGEPTGAVQIVTLDRKRHRETFNVSHTVLQLYEHILAITNAQPGFQIVAGFPPRALLDPSQTLGDAGLINSQVQMR